MSHSQTNARTTAIFHYLQVNGYFAWRQNNVGIYDPHKKIYRKNSALKGVADILALSKFGVAFAIEIKTGKDRQSEEQKYFQQQWESHGGIYIIASDVDDIIRKLNPPI